LAKGIASFREIHTEVANIMDGFADKDIEKHVLAHLQEHAGLFVDATATNLFREKLAQWRALYAGIYAIDGWAPAKKLKELFDSREPLQAVEYEAAGALGATPEVNLHQPQRDLQGMDLSEWL
jgi:hypothetical protein